jgi:hypothetical protein
MKHLEEVRQVLMDVVGEEGCGVSCEEADIFQDEEGWKLKLCGFLEPWKLGKTDAEAKFHLRELADMRFGLSH